MSSVIATLNGLALLELRISLERGSLPSRLEALLTDAPGLALRDILDVFVGDGAQGRRFAQFYVEAVERSTGGLVLVRAADIRAEWAARPVTVNINVPAGDGTAREPAGQAATLDEALRLLFEAAGIAPPAGFVAPGAAPQGLRLEGMPLNVALERVLARAGLTFTVDDDGAPALAPADAPALEPDAARLLEHVAADRRERPLEVVGGPPLELRRISKGWRTVMAGDGSAQRPQGEFFDLDETLDAWGVPRARARQACLGDGGFERLLGKTAPDFDARLAALRRFAFCALQAGEDEHRHLPWLPVGGVGQDGTLLGPKLTVRGTRFGPRAPEQVNEPFATRAGQHLPPGAYELDLERGVVVLDRPPFELAGSADAAADVTLQGRTVTGAPELELTIAVRSRRAPFVFAPEGRGEALFAPHLTAVYDENGALLNGPALEAAARALHDAHLRAVVEGRWRIAGVNGQRALGICERVKLEAGADGLTLTAFLRPAPLPSHTTQILTGQDKAGRFAAPNPDGAHQPLNAYRAGPLVIAGASGVPETETCLAARAERQDEATGTLELHDLGPLWRPFFMAGNDPALPGRWCFITGVETGDDGRVRVLGRDAQADPRHDSVQAVPFNDVRKVAPRELRGLMFSLDGDDRFFADLGPLVSDMRGPARGACSNYIVDLEDGALSTRRRGGLHFLAALALSPSHRQENVGGGDPGWVPVLNFRDARTGDAGRYGRGLFCEGDGRSLGRLGAYDQGGPVLADAPACEKHLFAQAADDGVYRECAGHLSTGAFFKVPGDATHDAPLKFYLERFEGTVPPWPVYEAQIKYDPADSHPFNGGRREGMWKLQYRVPFRPGHPSHWLPPRTPPRDDFPPPDDWPQDVPHWFPPPDPPLANYWLGPGGVRPVTTENEVWAPSHDWVPAPSSPDTPAPVVFPGPSLKSCGWAAEPGGVPAPALGGGAVLLPPSLDLSTAQTDSGERKHCLALHPQVVLAFGFPGFEGDGAGKVRNGWRVGLGADHPGLEITPLDETGDAAGGGELRLAAALRLGADVVLYRQSAGVLRTDDNFSVGGSFDVGAGLTLGQPLALAFGGTGAANAAGARANLGLTIGTDVQAHDADLDALAALSTPGLVVRTGAGAAAARSIGASAPVTISSGDGVAANPSIGWNGATSLDNNARVGVRKNGAGSTLTRRRVNFIEGANISLTVADDSADEEVDVTIAASGGLDFSSLAAESAPATNDEMAINDVSEAGGTVNRMTLLDLLRVVAQLAAETAPATGDEIFLNDVSESGGTPNKMTLANMLKVINGLSALTVPARNDYVAVYDTSASDTKRIALDNFGANGVGLYSTVVEYTGSGSSGKTVTLTGINRAYYIMAMRNDTTGTHGYWMTMPNGGTGTQTVRESGGGGNTVLSLDAPSAGSNQTLTINTTSASYNGSSVTYRLFVVGRMT